MLLIHHTPLTCLRNTLLHEIPVGSLERHTRSPASYPKLPWSCKVFHPTRFLCYSAVVKRIIRPVKFSTFSVRSHFCILPHAFLQLDWCSSTASSHSFPQWQMQSLMSPPAVDGLHCTVRIGSTTHSEELSYLAGSTVVSYYHSPPSQASPCTQSISHHGEKGQVPGKTGDIVWEMPSGQAGVL